MRAIDRTLVDDVWATLGAYGPARTAEEARAFLAQQPHVAAFTHAMIQGQDEAVQRAGLGLAFLLFKVVEASLGRPFPEVTEARLVAAHTEARAAVAAVGAPAADAVLRAMDGVAGGGLVSHVLAAFYGGAAAGYDDGVRANLALLLGALARALDLGVVEG